jgi:hypothetical protein
MAKKRQLKANRMPWPSKKDWQLPKSVGQAIVGLDNG